MQTAEPKKLGDLARHFRQIYELPEEGGLSELRHDGVHALTGFGIGVADELRVAIHETVLYGSRINPPSFQQAVNAVEILHGALLDSMRGEWEITLPESQLATAAFRRAQTGAVRLARKEIEKQYALGESMNRTIKELTGKTYRQLTADEIAALDFGTVDFTGAAHTIKRRYEQPENRAAERETAAVFAEAAARKGRGGGIPAAGSPWHGPLYKPYVAQAEENFKTDPIAALNNRVRLLCGLAR